MSSDREQDFADGMTKDIIIALYRVRELFVISRNSSSVYKGRSVRIEDMAKELGVRFVLEGSIRVAGGSVHVTAQLPLSPSPDLASTPETSLLSQG